MQTSASNPESPAMFNIAATCCDTKYSGQAACVRYIPEPLKDSRDPDGGTDDECIGGMDPPRAYTFYQTEQLCKELGLDTCDQNCADTGCFYNKVPVWTHLFCDTCDMLGDNSDDSGRSKGDDDDSAAQGDDDDSNSGGGDPQQQDSKPDDSNSGGGPSDGSDAADNDTDNDADDDTDDSSSATVAGDPPVPPA